MFCKWLKMSCLLRFCNCDLFFKVGLLGLFSDINIPQGPNEKKTVGVGAIKTLLIRNVLTPQ
jgi:hypothetical protein